MSKRNFIWMLAVILLGLLFWYLPDTVNRQRAFYRVFGPLEDIRAQVHKNYVEKVNDKKLLRGAIRGMIGQLDPFSRYIPMDQLKSFDQQTTGTIQGIGIFLEERDGVVKVISPLEDSPAFKAGILAGDRILRIDGLPTRGMTLPEVVKRLSGNSGTRVTIDVRHEISGKTEGISIIRSLVHVHSVKGFVRKNDGSWSYIIDRKHHIAYVRISGFLTNTAAELDQAWHAILAEGGRSLIIDLRYNPGGLLQTAVKIANRFLDKGKIVSTKGRFHQEASWEASREGTYKPMPMAVLVNQYSASASEILSGALQVHKRAILVGTRTFGKGSVQDLIPLEHHLGALKLTVAYYYLPNGRNIHRRPGAKVWGVDPDIEVKLTPKEQTAVLKSRRDADIIRVNGSATSQGKGKTSATLPHLPHIIIDKQLQAALEYLKTHNKTNEK